MQEKKYSRTENNAAGCHKTPMATDGDKTKHHQRTNHVLDKKQASTTEDIQEDVYKPNHVLSLLQSLQ
jgi:hypothetical protein